MVQILLKTIMSIRELIKGERLSKRLFLGEKRAVGFKGNYRIVTGWIPQRSVAVSSTLML